MSIGTGVKLVIGTHGNCRDTGNHDVTVRITVKTSDPVIEDHSHQKSLFTYLP